jgi:hypothetical protein
MLPRLKSLTVVILTRERQEVLEESIEYWHNCEIKSLVLDNSIAPLDSTRIPPSTNYIHCPGVSFAGRSIIASENIDSIFSIICSDDERYLPSALDEMLGEFEKIDNLVSVGGLAIGIDKYGPIVTGTGAYFSMRAYHNSDDDAFQRLDCHFNLDSKSNKIGALYRVYYSSALVELLKVFGKCTQISTPYIFEVTAEVLSTLLGGTTYVDTIYWVRNWSLAPVQKTDWDRRILFYNWWTSPEYQIEREHWLRVIMSTQLIDAEVAVITEYISRICEKSPRDNSSNRNLKDRLYKSVQPVTKYFIYKIFAPDRIPKQLHDCVESILTMGIKINTQELQVAVRGIQGIKS